MYICLTCVENGNICSINTHCFLFLFHISVSKPNVIVVQKTQHPRFQNPIGHNNPNIRTLTSSVPGVVDKVKHEFLN